MYFSVRYPFKKFVECSLDAEIEKLVGQPPLEVENGFGQRALGFLFENKENGQKALERVLADGRFSVPERHGK